MGALTADEHRLLALKEAGAWRDFLQLAVSTRRNIIISGATGSGKTTLSKALIAAIPAHERLITIEDTAELVVPHQNCVRLLYAKDGQGLAKIGPRELLGSCLRMRRGWRLSVRRPPCRNQCRRSHPPKQLGKPPAHSDRVARP